MMISSSRLPLIVLLLPDMGFCIVVVSSKFDGLVEPFFVNLSAIILKSRTSLGLKITQAPDSLKIF